MVMDMHGWLQCSFFISPLFNSCASPSSSTGSVATVDPEWNGLVVCRTKRIISSLQHVCYRQPKDVHLIIAQARVTATTTPATTAAAGAIEVPCTLTREHSPRQRRRGACKIISGYHTHLPLMSVCKLFNGFGLVQQEHQPRLLLLRSPAHHCNAKCGHRWSSSRRSSMEGNIIMKMQL